jgi:hypothetical protein
MEQIICIIVIAIVSFLLGVFIQYRKSRIQCVNCGGNNTYLAAAGYGGEGGECKFAVKHHEQHVCKDCNKITSIKMTLVK